MWRADQRTPAFSRTAGGGDTVRVRHTTERGWVLAFTVQYEAWIDEQYRLVVRYDTSNTAHGRAHRDVLDWSGETVEQVWLPVDQTFNDALIEAERDLREDWERYREAFLKRRP